MEEQNPFLSLFPTHEDAQRAEQSAEKEAHELDKMLARILLINGRVGEGRGDVPTTKFSVHLPQFSRNEEHRGRNGRMTLDNFDKALAERLQMLRLATNLEVAASGLSQGLYSKEKALEAKPIHYLANCYARAHSEKEGKGVSWRSTLLATCKKKVAVMAGVMTCSAHNLCILQAKSPMESDFVSLFMSSMSGVLRIPMDFFLKIADYHTISNLKVIFGPVLALVFTRSSNLSLSSPDLHIFLDVLIFFSQHPQLALLVVQSQHWLPEDKVKRDGKSFESHTLLGRLLRPSPLASGLLRPSEHFSHKDQLSNEDVLSITATLRVQLGTLSEKLHQIFSSLIRHGAEVKDHVLNWLVQCFKANEDKGKMMGRGLLHVRMGSSAVTTASDGFFLNLSWVLLQLSAPFTGVNLTTEVNPRLANVDLAYCTMCSRKDLERDARQQLVDFSQETTLAAGHDSDEEADPPNPLPVTTPVKFVTHCFFLTHRCLFLGLTQTIQLFQDINDVYRRVQRSSTNQAQIFRSQIFGMQAHLMHPQLLELSLSFYIATTQRLVQVLQQSQSSSLFPLPAKAPPLLACVPEILVENLADFTSFLWRTGSDVISQSLPHQKHIITFCVMFMGAPQLLNNPHLRAQLTQLLSLLIPRERDDRRSGLLHTAFPDVQRSLFESHELASRHLVEALLMIFIDIERTGDSMEFEDKFQYRMPMYQILEFVWSLPSYKPSIEALSHDAVIHCDRSRAPVFLRFLNMMINDATVQLDEGLENLMIIKKIEDLKASTEDWAGLTSEQRQEHEGKMKEAVMYATNRNILALRTVHTLEFITRDITKPFVTLTMVNRMAVMLNYFLRQLVGPQSRALKVKDKARYGFKPEELVSGIVTIYIHLGQEEAFCEEVPRDERSFSIDLFDRAAVVMRRIGKPEELCEDLITVKNKVKYFIQHDDESWMMDLAPEEFLDPIMGTLMSDPVTLPTSGNVMDRGVIIRHLLSDQEDPFNRESLTPDMLQPNDDLRQRIGTWKEEQRSKRRREESSFKQDEEVEKDD